MKAKILQVRVLNLRLLNFKITEDQYLDELEAILHG